MDNQSKDVTELREQISLQDLPIEVFLHICSFLDASTLVHTLSLVCKQFYEILKDDTLWKMRITRVWPNTRYPIVPHDVDDELFWKLSCVAIEKQARLWKDNELFDNFSLKNGHYGMVDAVLLVNNGRTCVSGGRDRLLICWSLSERGGEPSYEISSGVGHDGWIWDIKSMHDKIYSCSWDSTVRSWDINGSRLVAIESNKIEVQSALLCINSCPELNLLATGSFSKNVTLLDPRNDKTVTRYQAHSGAVIQIVMNSNYVISASEDKTVSVWDVRKECIMKTIQISRVSFPMSMFMHNRLIYIGDSHSRIHLLDEKKDFEVIKSYETEHSKGITGIHSHPGCLITSSLDKTVRIFSPTDPPQSITTFLGKHESIPSMHFLNDVLAASGDEAIEIWRPKTANQHYL